MTDKLYAQLISYAQVTENAECGICSFVLVALRAHRCRAGAGHASNSDVSSVLNQKEAQAGPCSAHIGVLC